MRRLPLIVIACLAGGLLAAAAPVPGADPEVHVFTAGNSPPGGRRPLLVFLHGLGGSGAEALANPALRALAERGGMVLLAPDGALDQQGRRFWNAGPACCNFDGKAVNDVARLEALIAHWLERPEIDPARVYVVGFSNGGFMAHRLACFMDDRLAAVVSIGGAGRAREEACAPVSPIAIAEVHGDADPIVRYQGGRVFNDRALDPHPSAPDTFHDWAVRLHCEPLGAPKVSEVDLDPRLPGAETRIESYPNCPGGTAELWTVHGGGHQVMTPALLARVGEFLSAHPKVPPKKKTTTKTTKEPPRKKRERDRGVKLPN
ncbi:MAG TPA: PHB depolymerase family esterase [Polyangia bacterium]|jgi:polyhydroxybutyrate depolymerase